MNSIEAIRSGVAYAHEIFMATARDLTTEMTHWVPPGIANPISAVYAHAMIEQDDWISLASGNPQLYASTWKDKTGISTVQNGITLEWARSLKIDLEKLHGYASTLHSTTETFVGGLSESDLDNMVDMSIIGAGDQSLGWVLGTLMINHISWMTGEISCLKGLQGERGYPF